MISTALYTFGLSLQYIFEYSTWISCVTNFTIVIIYAAFFIFSYNATKKLESIENSNEIIGQAEQILKTKFRTQSKTSTITSNSDSCQTKLSFVKNEMQQKSMRTESKRSQQSYLSNVDVRKVSM